MKGRNVLIGLLIGGLLSCFVGFGYAEIPRIMSFQGVLKDGSGKPVDDTVGMTFKLYTQDTGGIAVWTEVRSGANQVKVDNGMYSVLLGEVTAIPTSVAFDTSYWLGVTVGAGTEMSPRYRLAASPYALGAGNTGTGSITLGQWNYDSSLEKLWTEKEDVLIGENPTTVTWFPQQHPLEIRECRGSDLES